MADKRILIINNRIPYPWNDGGNIAVNAMIESYHSAGWKVYLLAMNTSRHYVPREMLKGIYAHIHAFETVDIDNEVTPISLLKNLLFGSKPNHAERFFKQAFARKLQEVIELFKPVVVQVESIYLTEYLPYIKALTNTVTVLRLHNIEYEVWERLAEITKNPIKKWFLKNLAGRIKKYEQVAWAKYNLLLPITDADAKVVKDSCANTEILTIPLAIDFSKIHTEQEKAKWMGYHIGAMDWAPNADGIWWFLHDVWPAINEEFRDFEFHFAGRNMPAKFKELNIAHVTCEGEVGDANKFIEDKKILFVPIQSGSGIRVKILEAMAREKLVISTGIGMQGIEAIPGQHYLGANTREEFVKALRWTLTHPKEAEEMCIAASDMARTHYDTRLLSRKLLDKVDSLLINNTLQG